MEIQSLNDECKEKDIKYKQLDKTYLSIIHIIEKQKKNIRNLQDKLSQKQKDESNKIKIIQEKEQEIGILKGFINSLKNENTLLNNSINIERKKNNQNLKKNNNSSNASSRINSGISNRNNNNVIQYRNQQQGQGLPIIKSNFNKNNINYNNGNYNNNYRSNNHNMEKNYSNESIPPMINNNMNMAGNNSNNNSFQNIQNNRANINYLNNQFQDLETHEEENFKQIDLLMKKIMNDY
jgi:hypothetical protein